jgi:hypothetical protein
MGQATSISSAGFRSTAYKLSQAVGRGHYISRKPNQCRTITHRAFILAWLTLAESFYPACAGVAGRNLRRAIGDADFWIPAIQPFGPVTRIL